MGRIRTIKPEFPQSETIGSLSRDARLLFIQLWTIVDDSGRARAASRMLASLLFPYDDDAPALIDGWMDELESAGCIRRYEVSGAKYLDLPNWLKHQKIDKPSASKIPAFDEASRSLASVRGGLATDLGPRTMDLGREETASAVSARPDFDELEAKLRSAAGLENDPSPSLFVLGPIQGLMDAGADLERDILPVLRAKAKAGKRGRSWGFYVSAIQDAVKARAGAASVPLAASAVEPDWRMLVQRHKVKGHWPGSLGPEPGYSGCRAPLDILAEHGYGKSAA